MGRDSLGVLSALALVGVAHAQGVVSENPRVVSTFPEHGSKVPPSVAELKVSYDHRMAASWSFASGGEKLLPEVSGQPSRSDDHITVTLPIRLEPNHSYVVWLNTDRYKNFKSEDGAPAEPFRLTFSTTD